MLSCWHRQPSDAIEEALRQIEQLQLYLEELSKSGGLRVTLNDGQVLHSKYRLIAHCCSGNALCIIYASILHIMTFGKGQAALLSTAAMYTTDAGHHHTLWAICRHSCSWHNSWHVHVLTSHATLCLQPMTQPGNPGITRQVLKTSLFSEQDIYLTLATPGDTDSAMGIVIRPGWAQYAEMDLERTTPKG